MSELTTNSNLVTLPPIDGRVEVSTTLCDQLRAMLVMAEAGQIRWLFMVAQSPGHQHDIITQGVPVSVPAVYDKLCDVVRQMQPQTTGDQTNG